MDATRWWEIRPAHNLKPVTYRCPMCGERLPALSEHLLLLPEGRPQGRRHAHTECVLAARRSGRLPTRDEWRASAGGGPATGPGRRLIAVLRRIWQGGDHRAR